MTKRFESRWPEPKTCSMCDRPALYSFQTGWDSQARRGVTEGRCKQHRDVPCAGAERERKMWEAREGIRQQFADEYDRGYRASDRKSKNHRDRAKAF